MQTSLFCLKNNADFRWTFWWTTLSSNLLSKWLVLARNNQSLKTLSPFVDGQLTGFYMKIEILTRRFVISKPAVRIRSSAPALTGLSAFLRNKNFKVDVIWTTYLHFSLSFVSPKATTNTPSSQPSLQLRSSLTSGHKSELS
jgi:hypothetical protein